MTQLYRDILTWAPPWMRTGNLETLFGAIGTELDARAEQYLQGRLQALVYANGARLGDGRLMQCDPFALPVLARDRGIILYPTEGELSQRIRVSQSLQLHQQRGTHRGELNHVRPYFADAAAAGFAYPTMYIVHQDGAAAGATWHKMSSGGVYSVSRKVASNYNYDGRTSLWSRWWAFVLMSGTGFTAPITYGSGHTYGDGSVYGAGGANPFSAARQTDIVAMFADWKSAHSWLGGVVLVWPPATLDPTGTPSQDADGRWSLPNGANTWARTVDPTTGKATRPYGYQWIFDNPA